MVNWLWLALANQRLAKAEEARRSLNKAQAWLNHQTLPLEIEFWYLRRGPDDTLKERLMIQEQTTAVVQRYIDELAGDAPAEPIVRALLDRSVRRLQVLCANLLYRGYPRLTQPPVNLQPDELWGGLWLNGCSKPCGSPRPRNVREFFALAKQHIRWELNAWPDA